MTRMTAPLKVMGAAAAASTLFTLWAAVPASAHGAPTDPVSRVVACSPQGGADARAAACEAAIAANGQPFTMWDNLRVANVDGRDRQVIPDGRLCSGNLPAYKGLDLARSDWPSTRLTPGATLTMKYASTIPHEGTFKLYLTKPGYDPTKPLAWSDLPEQPFAEAKDPALASGAYRIRAKLPSDRTGHHVLFTIWQNSSTPDTYYSCSDVVFSKGTAAAGGGAAGRVSASPAGKGEDRAADGSSQAAKDSASNGPSQKTTGEAADKATGKGAEKSAAPQAGQSAPDSSPVASATDGGSGPSAPILAGGAAAVLVLTGGAALALRLRRR